MYSSAVRNTRFNKYPSHTFTIDGKEQMKALLLHFIMVELLHKHIPFFKVSSKQMKSSFSCFAVEWRQKKGNVGQKVKIHFVSPSVYDSRIIATVRGNFFINSFLIKSLAASLLRLTVKSY